MASKATISAAPSLNSPARPATTVTVYTSDKDYLQLIDSNIISISLLKTGLSNMEVMDDEDHAGEVWFLSPKQIIDFKGLAGR
jgi:5'-3' exonuclease